MRALAREFRSRVAAALGARSAHVFLLDSLVSLAPAAAAAAALSARRDAEAGRALPARRATWFAPDGIGGGRTTTVTRSREAAQSL